MFPQLSLLGQTSSESYMRVDESLFSFFDFLLFLRFLTLVKLLTVEVITPTVTFFLLWVMTWKSLASATLYTTLGQLSSPVKRATPLIDSHQNLNQLKVDQCVRVDETVGGQTRGELRLHSTLILPFSLTIIN